MNKNLITVIAVGAVLVLMAACSIGTLNKENRLRNLVESKQKDNTSEFDNMWKKIQQAAQVPAEKRDALVAIFNGYAAARTGTGTGDKAPIMNWIKESVPNINGDLNVYDNLMNIITASRDSWTMRQKELIEFNNQHNTPFGAFPDGVVLWVFGRKKTEITIVTSSRTEKAFATGKDDESLTLFPKK